MSQASDLKALANGEIYEVMGKSGASYVIFFFRDASVCALRKKSTSSAAAAQLEFTNAKSCLDDCGMEELEGTTYQKGRELLKKLASQ